MFRANPTPDARSGSQVGLPGMEDLLSHLARRVILAALLFLPAERRRTVERRLRGRGQVRKLSQADVVIVSFGKSRRLDPAFRHGQEEPARPGRGVVAVTEGGGA